MGVVFSSHVIFTPASTAPPGGYPELPVIYSIGSMANGSNHLILSDAAGGTYFRSVTPPLRVPFQIGDKVIVEIGGEAGGGQRGTMGVGGAVAATNPANYFQALDAPKALVATILNITGGNDLTLDATAFTATTNARVYRDNTDGMNAENGAAIAGSTINWPAGTFAQYDYIGNMLVDNVTVQGQGKRVTQLYQPKGARRGGIAWGGGRTGLITQDMTIWGNAKWQGFGMADDIGSLFYVGCGVWIFNCFNSRVRRVESFNVFQKACWSEAGSGDQFTDCNMIQEEALQSYNAQWYFGASDATNCIVSNCTFYGLYLAPAYESFRSSGVQFLNCVSQNGCYSTNSSGNWLIENATITLTDDAWLSNDSFNILNPGIDVNSNISPPSGDILLGGIVRNFTFTVLGPLTPNNSYLIGARVGAFTPNVLFDGGTFTYPAFDNSGFPGFPFPALAISALNALPPFPPTTNCVLKDLTCTGFIPAGSGRFALDTIDVPGDHTSTIINCTGGVELNRVLMTGNYIGLDDSYAFHGWIAYWGLRAYSFASVGATAIRLRRTGATPGEQNFVTISTGDLDLVAIAAFLAGSVGASLFCVTLFDQVGTNHLTQATPGFQPAFTLSALNGHPILTFDGVDDHLTGTSNITFGAGGVAGTSVVVVAKFNATGAVQSLYTSGTASLTHTATANQVAINAGVTLTATSTGFDGTWNSLFAQYPVTGSASIIIDYIQTFGNAGTNSGSAIPDIGSGAGFFNGSLTEIAVHDGFFNLGHTYPQWAWQQDFYGF